MDTMTGMRTFLAVSEAGSFTAAARRLGVTTQLASKYVRQLESRLSVQLFHRTTRKVTLTDAGEAYQTRCRDLVDQFDELEAEVQQRQGALSGRLRITAPTGFGLLKLTPALAEFRERHSEVEIDLSLTDRRVSLVEEGLDLAIRIGRTEDSSVVMRRLMPMPYLVVASPAYLEKNGHPRHPQALETHECLVNIGLVEPGVWRFQEGVTPLNVRVSGGFKGDQPRALAEMARLGHGVTACPAYAVEDGIASGELVPLLSDYTADTPGVFALYPSRRHVTARLRALLDYLIVAFAKGGPAKA
jgi:DNA-binding transcriptional LysR family regulator